MAILPSDCCLFSWPLLPPKSRLLRLTPHHADNSCGCPLPLGRRPQPVGPAQPPLITCSSSSCLCPHPQPCDASGPLHQPAVFLSGPGNAYLSSTLPTSSLPILPRLLKSPGKWILLQDSESQAQVAPAAGQVRTAHLDSLLFLCSGHEQLLPSEFRIQC